MQRRDLITAVGLIGATIWLAPAMASSAPSEIAVIAHPKVGVRALSEAELNAIFTTRMQRWDGGAPIRPLNFPPRHELRVAFDRAVLGMGPDEVARFWIDRRVRGGNPPPRQVPSVKLMVGVVAKLEGAIGYAPADQAGDHVRVVARIRGGRVMGP